MNYFHKKILKDLFKSKDGLQPFTFYSRYKLSPEKMFELIDTLLSKKYIFIENNTLYISDKGRQYIFSKKIYANSENKFNNIPEEFLDKKIEINSLYIPDISYLSK